MKNTSSDADNGHVTVGPTGAVEQHAVDIGCRPATRGGIPTTTIGATGAGDHGDRQTQGQQNTSVATHGPRQGVDESNTAKRPPKRA